MDIKNKKPRTAEGEIRTFPSWHFPMMNDQARNKAIRDAIAAEDLVDKVVFEIGTGAGLTAIYFAKHGAKHVYTCEINKELHEIAKNSIKTNGLEHLITAIHASSKEFVNDNPSIEPDIIFTETIDCGVIGEGYFSICHDINSIAAPKTKILPSTIQQYGFLVESEELSDHNRVRNQEGIVLNGINKFSTKTYVPVRYKNHRARTLSDTRKIQQYSYSTKEERETHFSLRGHANGIAHGIITYFHAHFGDHVVSNDIKDTGHWHQAFHPFKHPIAIRAGVEYKMTLNPDGSVTNNE